MHIREIQFAPGVIAKIWRKHHVTDNEVREVLVNQPDFEFVERENVKGEDLYSAWGQTDAGRYLIVFFVYKLNQDVLVHIGENF